MPASKTALITGANKGIGFETCRQLLQKGYRVFVASRRKEEGRKAADELSRQGGTATFVYLDVTDPASVRKAGREVADQTDHLDALINNAGIYPDGETSILNVDQPLLEKSFLTNTAGAVLVSQAVWPLLARSRIGRIVNVSSGLGALSDMGAVAPSYSISKTALNAVTRQLAAALKDKGIIVNSVCPGWVRTEMGGQNAPRSVEEGASGIVWAATEAPAELTGNFLRDGKVIPW
jgi:NAD(P)-dependent dehydrogenase (short-subunit alcohol dehydrogenase family)